MNLEMAIELLRSLIMTSLLLISPLMGVAIGVGLLVSLIQTVTSIQDQTLTFVPKLAAVGFMIMVSANWLLRTLMEFTVSLIQRLPEMVR